MGSHNSSSTNSSAKSLSSPLKQSKTNNLSNSNLSKPNKTRTLLSLCTRPSHRYTLSSKLSSNSLRRHNSMPSTVPNQFNSSTCSSKLSHSSSCMRRLRIKSSQDT